MKTTNKFLSILLATILILSLFPVSLAHASDNTITFSAEADKVDAKAGDIISVSVSMTEYRKLGALTLVVNYDNTVLKVVSGSKQGKYGWEEFNTVYANNKLAYLVASTETKTVSGTLFTVQFEVLKDGCTEISLSVDELTDIDLNPLSSVTESAKIHNFDNGTVTQPTCTESGYTTYVCTGCSSEHVDNEVAETGHDYDYDNGVLTRPTETEDGYYTYTCKNSCNIPEIVPVNGADYSEFDKAFGKVAGYLYGSDLTDEAKAEILTAIQNYIANNPNFDAQGNLRRDLIEREQGIVDEATGVANQILTIIETNLSNCEFGNHDVKNYSPNNNATCTEDGTKSGNCYVCGKEVVVTDENNLALGHDMVIDKAVAPDCVNTGLTEGEHCSRCDGATITQETVSALGHKYNSVVTEPACTEGGYTTHTCTVCGDNYINNETPAKGHDYDEKITKVPTHTENGVRTFSCKGCSYTYSEEIKADGTHKHISRITKTPTCTENGIITFTCACKDEYTEVIPALGHDMVTDKAVAPDCVNTGLTEGSHCSRCDDVTTAQKVIPALGHDMITDKAVAPDCVNTGLTEGTHCLRCDDVTTEQEIVPALGHSHNSVVTAPTCTEIGYTTYTCAKCDDVYIDNETQATGHSFSNGICTVCGGEDPDYCIFSIKEPSRTTIRNKDGIILHTQFEGTEPAGSYVKWTSSNSNFDKTVTREGKSLRVIANNKGNTTFTATLYDVNGKVLATDSVELYSQSGFFDKIGGFFRSLFGVTKIYNM